MSQIQIRIDKDLSALDTEFRRAIDRMFHMINPHFAPSRHAWRPLADVFEMDREIIVTAELAGVNVSDIQVEADRRTLKISGVRKEVRTQEGGNYLLAEIPAGYFERILSLSSPIDTEEVTASFSQGILQIRLKKLHFDRVQNIPVHSR